MAMKGVYNTGASASLSALPQGYLQAATLPGKYIGQAIEKWGEEIGGAIGEYQKAKMEGEFLGQQFEGLQDYLDELTHQGEGKPEGWSDAFDKSNKEDLAKEIAAFGSMSLAQKKAKVMDMKFRVDQSGKDRDFRLKEEQLRIQQAGEDRLSESAKALATHRQGQLQLTKEETALGKSKDARDLAAMQTAVSPEHPPIPGGSRGTRAALIQEAIGMAATPEMAAKIAALIPDPVEATMGQNIAGARQYMADAMVGVEGPLDQTTGLPTTVYRDPQKVLTEALAKFGGDKDSTEAIIETFNERFGEDGSKIGTTFMLPGTNQMAVWTSKGQVQVLYQQEGKEGASVELQNALGFQFEQDLVGDGARMVDAMNRIAQNVPDKKLRGQLISELFELRQAARLAINLHVRPGLNSGETAQVKAIDQRLNILESSIAGDPNATNVGTWQTEIAKLEADRKKIYDAAGARWSAGSGRGGGRGGTRTYNPQTQRFGP